MNNAGLDTKSVSKKILTKDFDFNIGYNILKNEVVNMISEGIIDPAMAERVAIENAVSVASLMYNMDGVVVEDMRK